MRHHILSAALLAAPLALGCTPDIDTDPVPEVMTFEPTGMPPRVPEPSFLAINPATGKVDLGLAGIDVPESCAGVALGVRAQCEFNQYLESLDGFPSTAAARAPVSAAVDPASLTAANVAVVHGPLSAADAAVPARAADVAVSASSDGRWIQLAPSKPWPVNRSVWIGVRGYEGGIRAGGKPVVASTTYNLLRREESLTCAPATTPDMETLPSAEAIPAGCGYLAVLTRQMSELSARANLATLESLRRRLRPGWGWMEQAGGIPRKEAAMLSMFPIHKAPVIDTLPRATGADEIRMTVNGALDPATVKGFRLAEQPGSVVLMNLGALAMGDLVAGFPAATITYVGGEIVIKGAAPFTLGSIYGVVVTKAAKDTAGRSMIPPPLSVLLMARGPVVDAAGNPTVSALVGDSRAPTIEVGRQQLSALLDNPTIFELSGVSREQIAFLIAIPWGV